MTENVREALEQTIKIKYTCICGQAIFDVATRQLAAAAGLEQAAGCGSLLYLLPSPPQLYLVYSHVP
jgi:hypothetical protein